MLTENSWGTEEKSSMLLPHMAPRQSHVHHSANCPNSKNAAVDPFLEVTQQSSNDAQSGAFCDRVSLQAVFKLVILLPQGAEN